MESDVFAQELVCAVCLDLFVDPVTLLCGHTFCRLCVTQCWGRQRTGSCPLCRRAAPAGDLRGSRALRNLADRARGSARRAVGCEGTGQPEDFGSPGRRRTCAVCAAAPVQREPGERPLSRGQEDPLATAICSLKKARAANLESKLRQEQNISKIKEQSHSLHTNINSEFAELHQLLTEREQRLIRDLRQQEQRILEAMERNLRALSEDLEWIERELVELEEQGKEPPLPVKDSTLQWNRAERLGARPVLGLQLPLGVFKGPLQYVAWRGMRDHLSPAPAPLTLDPDTAHQRLLLTEELRAVSHGDVRRPGAEPGPRRFHPYVCVLAAQGFTSGRHYWEVEVSDKTKWDVGVVRESVDRKGRDLPAPGTGYWMVWLRNGREYWALSQPRTRLSPRSQPRTVGIYLDYEGGQVSFYDADGMVHLYTFTDTFTERLYPYFSPGLNDGGRNAQPLRISGGTVRWA